MAEPEITQGEIFSVIRTVMHEHVYKHFALIAGGFGNTCSCGSWVSPLRDWAAREDHEEMHRIHVAEETATRIWELLSERNS